MTEELEVNEEQIRNEIEKLDKQLEQIAFNREVSKIEKYIAIAEAKLKRLEEKNRSVER